MPAALTLLVSALGVAVNFATDLRSSVIAWVVVVFLALIVAATTAIVERRGTRRDPSSGTIVARASPAGDASRIYGLVMRRSIQTTNLDGTVTTAVIDYFSEELALQSLREDSVEQGTGGV